MGYPFDCVTDFIFVEDEPTRADILLIPGGSRPQLMEKAIELYRQGLATYILPSGGANKKLNGQESEWKYLQNIALTKGVPENAILREDQAKNTFENAAFSWRVIQQSAIDVKKAILVCKAHHARRALLTYQTAFPSNVAFTVCPIVDEREVSKESWFLDEAKIALVLSEVEKIGQYFAKYVPDWVKNQVVQIS